MQLAGLLTHFPAAAPLAACQSLGVLHLLAQQQAWRGLSHASEAAKLVAGGAAGLDVSEDLLKRLKEPTLLHTAGLVGGKWTGATNGADYQVGGSLSVPEP